jgi:hypothetical protein
MVLGAPCTTANVHCTEWITPAGQQSRLLIYRNYPLETKNDNITRALILVRGINRDGDNHFRTALAAAFLADGLNNTVIVVTRFASNSSVPGNQVGDCHDALGADEANWVCEIQRADTWRFGGGEVGNDKLTSFDFMDEIVRRLARKEVFPNLRIIVIAGHSAGGQFVIRYEMSNRVHDSISIPISYVVSNSSAYTYVKWLNAPGAASCSSEPWNCSLFCRNTSRSCPQNFPRKTSLNALTGRKKRGEESIHLEPSRARPPAGTM